MQRALLKIVGGAYKRTVEGKLTMPKVRRTIRSPIVGKEEGL